LKGGGERDGLLSSISTSEPVAEEEVDMERGAAGEVEEESEGAGEEEEEEWRETKRKAP
jgi:hypothetical protein